jgi:hypothetical protein
MVEGVRNALRDSCDECGKEVIYEKDDDSELDSIEVEPRVWKQLCEDCAETHRERERGYLEDDNSEASFARPDLE